MCAEWPGPEKKYRKLGMTHLRLPTVDHFEPTVSDLEKAVAFIQKYHDQGEKVYVHCRAGHGRSAAVVFAWLVSKDPNVDLRLLNQEFCRLRNVRKTLWRQKNIKAFHAKLQGERGGVSNNNNGIEMTKKTSTSDEEDEDDHKEL